MLDTPLILVTGKGGVGRSAVASALARVRAGRGERVLAIAIDRGAGLAAHLGAASLGHTPTAVGPNLSGSIVDPASALDEYVRLRSGSMPVAVAARAFRMLALTVPGVREIVLIGKVWHEIHAGPWDSVIVDAPPAGQVQSTMQAPATIAELVPRGSVHDEATTMAHTLADPDVTGLVIVATPEELALTEAEQVDTAATVAGMSSARRLVLNRVLQAPGFSTLPRQRGPRREAAALHLEVLASQTALAPTAEAGAVLPLLFGTHSPTEVSVTLAGHLEQL